MIHCECGHSFEDGEPLVHRLKVGDATDTGDVEQVMGGEKADLLLTDPPYKLENESDAINGVSLISIKRNAAQTRHLRDFSPNAFIKSIPSDCCSVYLFTSKTLVREYLNLFNELGFHYTILFWKKQSVSPLFSQDYLADVEYILYFSKAGKIWNTDGEFEDYYRCRSVNSLRGQIHPTTKPVELLITFIKNSSQNKGIVYDPFLGSGTTMVAAENLGRRCFGIEISEAYCAVILQRMTDMKCKCILSIDDSVVVS